MMSETFIPNNSMFTSNDILNEKENAKKAKIFFTYREIFFWIGLSMFEIFVNLISVLTFSVFLAFREFRLGQFAQYSWWTIFSPLFAADLVNGFFCLIVYVRTSLTFNQKIATSKLICSTIFLLMLVLFKLLLCRKFTRSSQLEYSEIFAPLFILLQLIAIRACQLSQ